MNEWPHKLSLKCAAYFSCFDQAQQLRRERRCEMDFKGRWLMNSRKNEDKEGLKYIACLKLFKSNKPQ